MPLPRLTKSQYLAGRQCHLRLWWERHQRGAVELVPNEATRWRLEQGREVGLLARHHVPHAEYERRVATAAALAAIDILEPLALGHVLIEVKASTRLRPHHLEDIAFQWYVAEASGLPITRAELMHLNRDCRHPALESLFRRVDVTGEVLSRAVMVPQQIQELHAVVAGARPTVAPGSHCTDPRPCPFFDRCNPQPPPDHVSRLHRISDRQLAEFGARGIGRIGEIPDGDPLPPLHARQRAAVRANDLAVTPGIGARLEGLVEPLAFLDFETVSTAVPRLAGTAPWENVPAQFSVHRLERHGRLIHHAWVPDGPDDPRPMLAARLVEACGNVGTVIGYNTGFESRCLAQLASAVPAQRLALEEIQRRLFDLLPVVRDHVYHPAFQGSFSLKSVLPVLVPALSHGRLAGVQRGDEASALLGRLLFESRWGAEEQEARREELRRYCELDTLALVRLLERLRALDRR